MHIEITCKAADILPLDTLRAFQGDLKTITDDNLDKLKRRIMKHGINAPVFVWRDNDINYLLDGHQRIKALKSLFDEGHTFIGVPVAYIQAENIQDAKDKLLGITSQYGEFNTEGFFEFTGDIEFEDIRLTNDEIFFQESEPEETTGDDEIPEAVEPVTKLGDLWELGEHRLLCGDSTKVEDVERLMDGCYPDIIQTDPPYGMNAVSKSGVLSKTYKTDINGDDNPDIAKQSFNLIHGMFPKSKHVWWGANYYCSVLPDSECWLVWDKNNGESDQTDCELAWANFRSVVRQFTMASEKVNRVHPTQKPVKLVEWIFKRFKLSAETIADFFGGSGYTVVAAEKNGKLSYTMENDPHFVDVIRDRYIQWCEVNGKQPVVKLNGEKYNFAETANG